MNETSFLEFLIDSAATPESQAEAADLRRRIWEALSQLPSSQRAVIVLRDYMDISESEIAQQTLDEIALGGGYQSVMVNDQPALYRQDCWEGAGLIGNTPGCQLTLNWFENAVRYEIFASLDRAVPMEMIIAIAESMR